jgi:Spy/CpxP family protein refolding chaperone
MKKLIIAALLVVGITAFAQNRKEMGNRPDKSKMEKFSPEQRTQLMVKKLTLDLDLNAKQQEQVKQIIAEQGLKRESMRAERMAKKEDKKRPTADEQFAMKNQMLDDQIAMKNKMKTILTPEQFEKWNSLNNKRQEKFQDSHRDRNHENCDKRERDDK